MKFISFLCICTQTSITLPFLSNIPASPAYTYGVYISQLICFSRACVFENIYVKSIKDPLSFEIWIFCNGQPDCDDDRSIFAE
jgi:hypothetical protein